MKKHNTMKVVLLVVTALWLISALFLPDKDWGVLVKCGLSVVELFLLLFALKGKNNTLKVVLVTTFALCILAWILPAAYYSGEYIDQGRVQIGLFDIFNYSLTSLSYFGYIGLFLILVGGFYGILHKIPARRADPYRPSSGQESGPSRTGWDPWCRRSLSCGWVWSW